MDASTLLLMVLGILFIPLVIQGIKIVPQQQVWIVEKLGRFDRKLDPGLNILIPYIDRVAYKHSLKEEAVDVMEQTAITNDNVTLRIDGVLYLRIIDPVASSYGVKEPHYAVTQLAQTTMRSEIGKMTLDRTFEERDTMNANIVQTINEAASSWGIQCMRYEIRDINPPASVLKAMELQMAAERQKRAEILESEGKRQAQINLAEAYKQEVVLKSEAALTDQINRAKGEGEAILIVANATANGLRTLGEAIETRGGEKAMTLRVAEQYVESFRQLAQKSTTLVVPANPHDAGGMIAEALTIFQRLNRPGSDKA